MKYYLKLFYFFLIPFFLGINLAHAQLTFNNALTAEQLAQIIVGSGMTISNATINCDPNAIGSFSGTSNIGIASGITLTTGTTIEQSPNSGNPDVGICSSNPAGDSQLNTLFGTVTCDACALEFDVIPICDTIAFNYCFGSDEYPEYACSVYNDVFAFFINGPNPSGGNYTSYNMALIPNTTIPVSINTVNSGVPGSQSGGGSCTSLGYSQYYVNNTGTSIEWDGFTTVLKASVPVLACQTYHMKIVIADGGSGNTAVDCIGWDSGVFIAGGSLSCSSLSASAPIQNVTEGCQNGSFQFCRPGSTASSLTIPYTIAGTAINGIDYNTIANSITIPAGQSCATLPIVGINDGIAEPTETIMLIYQPGSCPTLDTVIINISESPQINAGPDVNICSGENATIGILPVAGTTYTWLPALGLSSSTSSNPTVTLTNTTALPISPNYILSADTNGCVSFDTVKVTVSPLPTANAGSVQHVCSGLNINLAGSIGGSASSATWSGGAGTYTPGNNALNAIYTPTTAEYAADSVILTLSTNDPIGPCPPSSSNVIFYFYKNPVVNFTADNLVGCPILCTNFTDSTFIGSGDTTISWNWNFGDGSSESFNQNPSHCFSTTGFYDIQLTTSTNHGCSSSLIKNHFVQVFSVPLAAFNPTPNPADVLDPVITMNNQCSSDVNYWHWDFGDNITLAPTTSNPVHIYPNTDISSYLITLYVKNASDCYDTVAHEIFIGPSFTFYIPNSFSPNADGTNDYFYGSGIGIKQFDLWVFDRWGNMIFHGVNLDDKWNGKANGGAKEAQIDVYVWKVKLTDIFNKIHEYNGTVTLVK